MSDSVTNAGIVLLRALIGSGQWDAARNFAHLFQGAFKDQAEIVYGYYKDHLTSEHMESVEEFIKTIEEIKGTRELVCMAIRSYPYRRGYWCLALYFNDEGIFRVSHVKQMTYPERTLDLRLMEETLPELSKRLGVPIRQDVRAGRPVSSTPRRIYELGNNYPVEHP